MMRTFRLSPDYVLHDLSYANLILYGASQPSYRKSKERGASIGDGAGEGIAGKASAIGRDTEIDGDDPANRRLIDALLG